MPKSLSTGITGVGSACVMVVFLLKHDLLFFARIVYSKILCVLGKTSMGKRMREY